MKASVKYIKDNMIYILMYYSTDKTQRKVNIIDTSKQILDIESLV